jgi:DegV family protein with EDD domain
MVAQFGLTVVPLNITFGPETCVDGELTGDEFWHKVSTSPHHPGTSQPSMGAFEEAFARLVEAGHPVLCVTITGKHSGTYSTAVAAARGFGDQVRVVDSLSISLGQGFQVLAAARAAMRGEDLDAVAQTVQRVQARSHLLILLDTIEYVRRGGRADALMPVLSRVTKMLRIKPILSMPDGYLSLDSLTRSYERGLAQVRQQIEDLGPPEALAVIHIRHPDVAHDTARTLSERLRYPLEDIVVTETGALLSTHGGPKVIGVASVTRAP